MPEIHEALLHGSVAPTLQPVVDAFRNNFLEHGDVGAAVSVYHHGRCVVDLWGGLANPASGRPWRRDTLQLVFSAAKGLTATCINQLIDRGLLDIDLPVAHYWPEFGCNGKEAITTRMVLSHQAGLAAIDGDLTLDEVLRWDPVIEAIAAQAPNWPPGSAHGYHARSFGWILGEILRRITGQSIGRYFSEAIATPLNLRTWIGLPFAEIEHCATLIPPPVASAAMLGANNLTTRVMNGPSDLFSYSAMWNQPAVLQAELPSSNAVTDARSLARFYAALNGDIECQQLLSPAQLAKARSVQVSGPDKVILRPTSFGLGYAIQPFIAPGAGPNCFGHAGAGGALAFADPDAHLGFAYVMNAMQFNPAGDARTATLIKAVYSTLGMQ